jgi:Predicted redox protein, regulator of disulfide bond formation
MAQDHYYDVTVNWADGRKGTMTSEVLETAIDVATPPQFAKGIEGIWSPEHLFVAAVNSCLMTTFLAIAENSKLVYAGFTSKAVGKLELVEGKYIISEVTLKPTVVITNVEDQEKAMRLLRKSEAACLVSNSIKSKIILEPTVKVF